MRVAGNGRSFTRSRRQQKALSKARKESMRRAQAFTRSQTQAIGKMTDAAVQMAEKISEVGQKAR